MKLVEKYGDHAPDEWPMLFQRILQNTIRDYFRRSKIRALWVTLFSSFTSSDDGDLDPLDIISADNEAPGFSSPQDQLEQTRLLSLIETEIAKLPARQREAFVLRYWEEMGISETASVMGCSEGSVKTHCSRATHALATALKAKGITL